MGAQQHYDFLLAEHPVEISTAGTKLQSILCKAFSHLPTSIKTSPDTFKISVWDETESGIILPEAPWQWPTTQHPLSASQFTLNNYFVGLTDSNKIFYIYDSNLDKAIVCIKDTTLLPNYFLSSPFIKVIQQWSKKMDLNILHAGCVANDKHSVLFVGNGGKGKSTSSIQCLMGGLNYISDDYLLVKTEYPPVAYSIYCSGKLHSDHLKKFPEIAAIATEAENNIYSKPLIYLNELFGERIILSSPIKGIIVPNITSSNNTHIEKISAFEALKALAPSTLIQLDNGAHNGLSKMANLARKLPCYRLNMGSNLEEIAPVVKALLNSL